MRLIFLYYSQSQNPNKYEKSYAITENPFAVALPEEGLYQLFKAMVDVGIISECLTFIESMNSPGTTGFDEGMPIHVVQNINEVKEYLHGGDIVFVRGGWKRWYPFLQWMEINNMWMWLYAANTGRQRWDLWDIVFDDLTMMDRTDPQNRNFIGYPKPVNEDIFNYMGKPYYDRHYDYMIGASNIHDKKGQWKAINAVKVLQSGGVSLRAVMPGSGRRGVYSNKIVDNIRENGLGVWTPGEVSREDLSILMNNTKVFIHAGSSGQHDRGPIEAMMCGCRLVVASPTYHSPFVTSFPNVTTVPSDANNPVNLAQAMSESQRSTTTLLPTEINAFARKQYGIKEKGLPLMEKLFGVFNMYPYRNIEALRKEFGIGTV